MSVPHSTRVLPPFPFKLRPKSISSTDDMPSLDSYNRNDSSSTASSSPMPPTPFASSSPPGYPHIKASPGYLSRRGPSDYSDDYEDVSALWPLARGGRLNSLYAFKHPAFPSHSDDEPHWTSKSDASALHDRVILENKHLSPDDTDEEDEYEAFGDIKRQTCFATSSERGRWKSSPIPIKTYSHPYASTSLPTSRSIEETKPGLAPLNISGKSNSNTHSQWRHLSTASSISEHSISPIAPTLPSLSQEPFSPLPPSSPPTSPMSATFSMLESDDMTEEDMLVDSDDEHQSEHVPDPTNSHLFSLHDAAHPESESEDEEDSLIPAIATLEFIRESRSVAPTLHKPILQPSKPTPIHESIVLPHVTTMPTPETTPVAQERDPTPDVVQESLLTPPQSITPPALATVDAFASPLLNEPHPEQTPTPEQPPGSNAPSTHIPMPISTSTDVDMAHVDPIPTSSATTRQPLTNEKNEPHAGQTTTPEQPPRSHAPSTHIPMPPPTAVDVDANTDPIPTSPAITSLSLDQLVEECQTPLTKKVSEPHPAQSSTAESPLRMDVDAVSIGPSCAVTPSSESTLPTEGSVDQLPPANKKNQLHFELAADCAQTELSVNIDALASMSAQTNGSSADNIRRMSDKDESGNLATTSMNEVQKEVKGVGAKPKKVRGDGDSKETEKKGEVAKKVIKPPRPSKPIIRKEAASKAGPSKPAPVVDSTKPRETPRAADAVTAEGKEPVKRKKKVEETGEGPVRKKKKVAKDESAIVEASETAKNNRNADPSSSKPKTKKAKASQTASTSKSVSDHSPSPSPPLDIDSVQIAEVQGMIIESFAASRASTLPASTLYRSITDNRPSLKSVRSEEQWIKVIEMALEEGQSDSGVFGKVESSFKDETDRALEAKWFYVPERDVDQERASLISSMMPRAAKRTETKKYKQYYYRPLDKISRWDPEDDP